MRTVRIVILACLCVTLTEAEEVGAQSFVNFETPHVHPLDLTPDGKRLVAVNTADNRLEVFDVAGGIPVWIFSVPVGVDPVSVRARSNSQVWVVNHVSDSVSIVDLPSRTVTSTVSTLDEPCDVVFAGSPEKAFVSCSAVNRVMVFDPDSPATPVATLTIEGEDPRSLAVSPDGNTVYAAVFESGNRTTILGGGSTMGGGFPPNAVNNNAGPYGGVNPPPNDGAAFSPPQAPGNPPPPAVGMIVRKNDADQWVDDNNGDWTDLVSGANAAVSGRPVGWDLADHDLAIIDAGTLSVSYATGLMNICMALAVNPATGAVTVVGTDAINEVRFEPNLEGRFIRVNFAHVPAGDPGSATLADLNDHLDYMVPNIPQAQRDLSIGDPRGVAWAPSGLVGYVTGMGSNNLIIVDALGNRLAAAPIEVGEGPTGVVLDAAGLTAFVLNKFEGSVTVIDTATEAVAATVPFYDPSPAAIKLGRRHLYGTHETSGLGHTSCASCHVDARMDRLAWDLGDPSGDMKPFNQNCGNGVDNNCQDWHPMKGPMATQTLQDIIGREPHHWRGDREGIEAFNGAFVSLLGDNEMLSNAEMQAFEDFLGTIHFPPNPYRNFDNSLPTSLPLPGHFTPGRFAPAGQPLPNGNAVAGLDLYRNGGLDGVECVSCHSLPTGIGSNYTLQGLSFVPLPPGPDGELHHSVVSVDGSTNISIKVPQLRNMYDKVGFELTQQVNLAGFGFLHDGSVDSLARFVSEPVFQVGSDQEIADLVAFMLAFAGSDLPAGSASDPLELPGTPGLDAHAAVGAQATLDGSASPLINDMLALADAGAVDVVVKGRFGGVARGFRYAGAGAFQSDRQAETVALPDLEAAASVDPLTFTVVPSGSGQRIGVDRDSDGFFDRDEWDACSHPADPSSTPAAPMMLGDFDLDGFVIEPDAAALAYCVDAGVGTPPEACVCVFDFDLDNDVDCADVAGFVTLWEGNGEPPVPESCAAGPGVPAASEWGLAVMLLLVVSAGTLAFRIGRVRAA